jgi:hypothetical protein
LKDNLFIIMSVRRRKRAHRITYDIFTQAVHERHGDRFDLSEITRDDIDIGGSMGRVSVTCRTCGYKMQKLVTALMNSEWGCANCSDRIPWTLEKFLKKAQEKHHNLYDYSDVKASQIVSNKSKVPITCKACGLKFYQSIHNHIISECGCLRCNNRQPWTTPRFYNEAFHVHGSKHEYPDLPPIEKCDQSIRVKCKECNQSWDTTVTSYIYRKFGCPHCSRVSSIMTFDEFKTSAAALNHNRFTYSKHDVFTTNTNITATCNRCSISITLKAYKHLENPLECRNCDLYDSDDS